MTRRSEILNLLGGHYADPKQATADVAAYQP
jgi:hypothetical protein